MNSISISTNIYWTSRAFTMINEEEQRCMSKGFYYLSLFVIHSTRGVPKIMLLAFVLLKDHFTCLCRSKYSPAARIHLFRQSSQF